MAVIKEDSMKKGIPGKVFSFGYWRNLFSHRKPFHYVFLRIMRIAGLGPFIKFDAGGYRLYLFPTSISADLWLLPGSRPYDMLPCIRPGNIVVDVGANIGTTVISAALRTGTGGKVYAFEAHPEIFGYLNRNTSLNGLANVSTFNVAVGDGEAPVSFSDYEEDECNRIVDDREGIPTKAGKLDDLLRDIGKIDLLKIDVEGYELFVLKGAMETLKRTGCVNVEISEQHFVKYGYHAKDVFDFIWKSGFKCFRLFDDRRCEEVSKDTCNLSGYYNIIAVRDIHYIDSLVHVSKQEGPEMEKST